MRPGVRRSVSFADAAGGELERVRSIDRRPKRQGFLAQSLSIIKVRRRVRAGRRGPALRRRIFARKAAVATRRKELGRLACTRSALTPDRAAGRVFV